MEKHFCDRCGKEVAYDELQKIPDFPDDVRVVGLNEGAFGAELFKVIKVNDEVEHLYAASYQADLCRDCQIKLNVMVNQFIKGYEG